MAEPDLRDDDLASLVERQAAAFAERRFLSFGSGESMSFRQFERGVAGVRGHLRELGARLGDRVALMMDNSLFYPVAWFGVMTAGCVAVLVNRRLGPVDAGYLLGHSGASLVVADEAARPLAERAATAMEPAPRLEIVSTTDYQRRPPGEPGDVTAGSIANVQYTSGTTGFPKGCLLTHRGWQRWGASNAWAMRLTEEDTIITAQPHSYVDPCWNVVAALQSGAHLVLLDGFHPGTFMRAVVEWGVTKYYCVGTMPTLLLKQPPDPADRAHRLEAVFSSAIPPTLHRAIEDRWGVPWFETYGMTETGLNLAVSPEEHDELIGSGSIGRPLAHCEASVADEDDRELPPGAVGELRVRGLGLMEGYHRDPQATAAFFRHGWAHTGDLVERDEEGRFFFRGRRKDMVRRGGENISSVEVEAVLASHPDVVECAVAAVPDADMGEEAKAYVVLRQGADTDAPALRDHLADRLARFKVPRYFEFRTELPRTPSERIAKHLLEAGRASWRDTTVDLGR